MVQTNSAVSSDLNPPAIRSRPLTTTPGAGMDGTSWHFPWLGRGKPHFLWGPGVSASQNLAMRSKFSTTLQIGEASALAVQALLSSSGNLSSFPMQINVEAQKKTLVLRRTLFWGTPFKIPWQLHCCQLTGPPARQEKKQEHGFLLASFEHPQKGPPVTPQASQAEPNLAGPEGPRPNANGLQQGCALILAEHSRRLKAETIRRRGQHVAVGQKWVSILEPSKWNQGQQPAVPWCFSFDPYPRGFPPTWTP